MAVGVCVEMVPDLDHRSISRLTFHYDVLVTVEYSAYAENQSPSSVVSRW